MLLIRFIMSEDRLYIENDEYKATCTVRNELNNWREKDQVVKTFPVHGERRAYYPRKFPTGLWRVKRPEWTDNPEYAPVKIPTDAVRTVITWSVDDKGNYEIEDGQQDDAFYHLHYASNSSTTLGCIRLDSAEDAVIIANQISLELNKQNDVWLEVIASR